MKLLRFRRMINLPHIKPKLKRYDKTVREYEQTKKELEELRRELEKRTQFEIMLSDARQEVDYYKKMVEVKQLMLQKYSEEVDKFKSLYNQPKRIGKSFGFYI